MGPAGRVPELTSVEHRPRGHPVRGWRYWQLDPATGVLRSVTHRRVQWLPHRPLVAACLIGGHSAPAPGCACGVHASADLASLRRESLCLRPGERLVAGEVSLWGAVVADDHGLRGQLAYPARLLLVAGPDHREELTSALAQLAAYDVPVATATPGEAVGEVAAAILTFQAMSEQQQELGQRPR